MPLVAILALVMVLAGVGAFAGTAQANSTGSATTATTTAIATTASTHAVAQPAPDPADVVQAYFRVLNDRDFLSAWALGGRQHIAGQTYDAFVRSFNEVSKYEVRIDSVEGNKVAVELDATQIDKTHRHYAGTYTVEDGVIVAADIHPK
ncbi:hypothetical protein [Streptomyces sp. NPDC054786]